MAMYLISCHKKGISSVQLATDINVSQKSAWHILQKIRTLFQQDDSVALDGEGDRFTTMLSNAIGLCTYEQVKMVA